MTGSDPSALELGLDTFGDVTRDESGALVSDAQTIRDVVEQAVLADEVGLAFFGVGEHHRPEFAAGAIADGVRVLNEGSRGARYLSPVQLREVEERERAELLRRTRRFGSIPDDLSGITAIVVDDGVATGATALAACRSLRSRGCGAVVLAVPVAPAGWEPDPETTDEYVCPHRERDFWAVGQFYDDFIQTSDAEVVELLSPDLRDD